ncbi:uncharacterized protein [Amphiura filiformis]|uniref:uncharacterized protein n=1 Tax=Amphiura filiformis TaxID=82378 RepID=UPI003B212E22
MNYNLLCTTCVALLLCCKVAISVNKNVSVSACPLSYITQIGSEAIFNCTVAVPSGHSLGNYDIRWFNRSIPFPDNSYHGYQVLEDGTSQLLLSSVQASDSGLFTCCLVQDDEQCGDASRVDVQLEVGLPPGNVQGLTCFSRNINYGYCVWNNSEIDTHLELNHTLQRIHKQEDYMKTPPCFEMGLGRAYAHDARSRWEDAPCDEEVPGAVSINADNVCYVPLQGGDHYYYRVVTKNQLGMVITDMIHPDKFSIFVDAIPLPPERISLEAETSNTILVTWQPPPGFVFNKRSLCNKLGYRIRYQNDNGGPQWVYTENVNQHNMADICNPTYGIDKLHPPYSNVCIQISSENNVLNGGKSDEEKQWSEWSQVQCTRLLEEAPEAAPNEFTASNIEHEEKQLINVILTWKPISEEKRNGLVLGYSVSVIGRLETDTLYRRNYSADANSTSLSVKGLNRTYEYTFEITAFNSAGNSPKESTTIQPTPINMVKGSSLYALIVIAVVLPVAVAVICMISCCCWKKLSEQPDYEVKIPSAVYSNHNIKSTNFRVQEPEEFDELCTGRPDLSTNNTNNDKNYQNNIVTMNLYQNFSFSQETEVEEFDHLVEVTGVGCTGNGDAMLQLGMNVREGGRHGDGEGRDDDDDDDEIVYYTVTPQGLSPIKTKLVEVTDVGCTENGDEMLQLEMNVQEDGCHGDGQCRDDDDEIVYHTVTPQGLSPIKTKSETQRNTNTQPTVASEEATVFPSNLSSTVYIHSVEIHSCENDCISLKKLAVPDEVNLSGFESKMNEVTEEETTDVNAYVQQSKVPTCKQTPVKQGAIQCPSSDGNFENEEGASYSKASIASAGFQVIGSDEGICIHESKYDDHNNTNLKKDHLIQNVGNGKCTKSMQPSLPELVIVNEVKEDSFKKNNQFSCPGNMLTFDPRMCDFRNGYLQHPSGKVWSSVDDGYSSNGNGSLPDSPNDVMESKMSY